MVENNRLFNLISSAHCIPKVKFGINLFQSKFNYTFGTKQTDLQELEPKVWSEMNLATLEHFRTVSGHLFGNYKYSFHKTEDLTVILRCPTYLNLN